MLQIQCELNTDDVSRVPRYFTSKTVFTKLKVNIYFLRLRESKYRYFNLKTAVKQSVKQLKAFLYITKDKSDILDNDQSNV